ncbi:vWA domain-containing protein [Candidatus Leptofilum sp.]|uniref:vWA domain-containing protein n=1 Tax=Candidatus Leptofilum sp. TaxID=3241576 RepID=UPI003B5B0380
MMIREQHSATTTFFRLSLLLLLFLLLLAACGGADEAVEEAGDADTSEIDDTSDSETIEDGDIGATGSEEDSGEIPPTPEPGSKVEEARSTPIPASADAIAANPAPPADRVEAENTAVLPNLDLVFLIDVTGSMSNELSQLQANLPDFVNHLATLSATVNLRLGLVMYRDQGKLDASQLFDFTEDTALFADQLATLTAVGGGDYAEAMNDGLYQAVTRLSWRTESAKLLIIVGDAPPRATDANAPTFEETSTIAAEQDIIIYTVGSDGLDAEGVATYQQIAQIGNGRFYFVSDNPEVNVNGATAVYPTSQLTTIVVEIVQEVLDAQIP